MAQEDGEDIKGESGGDTGETKQVGTGAKAEKGDARRENRRHSGPTRPGAPKRNPVDTSGHAGSDKSVPGGEHPER